MSRGIGKLQREILGFFAYPPEKVYSRCIPPGSDGLRSLLVPFYRAARRRSTPLVPTWHQGLLVQCLDQADQGSTDDTCHTPASAHDASRTCRITRRISRVLNGLTTDGRATCVKKAWASGLNTSPVRKMTRDTKCGWRRASSR
jgi:hypothetical protein